LESKFRAQIIAIQINKQADEHDEVDDKPHHKAAFFAFIFYMVRHDGIVLMKDFG
jgi:hypothetical protein